MKIAWVLNEVLVCGGVKIPFGYCRELQKLGFDSQIYANGRNKELEDYYGVQVHPIRELEGFTADDVIIAVWWMQVPELEKYHGRKIQFVQGHDLKAYIGTDLKEKCLEIRQRRNWEILAVSDYAGRWTERGFVVVPNAIDDIFFQDYGMVRDIDALIEGNGDDRDKQIGLALAKAREDGHQKIVWLGTRTREIGVETITNPPQAELPKIYQRARHFYKYSKSEGFCLPIVEAKASGCIIHTHDMGHNFPEDFDPKEYNWTNSVNKLLHYLDVKPQTN